MVEYERRMDIIYSADWVEESYLHRRVASLLHSDEGLSQVAAWWWGVPTSDMFGFQVREESDTIYTVSIDEKAVFSLKYQSQAEIAEAGLREAGYTVDCNEVRTVTTSEKWMSIGGDIFYVDIPSIEGTMDTGGVPCLKYEDNLSMVIKFDSKGEDYVLSFIINFEAETIEDRKAVETMVVDVPLNDMRIIREAVERTLDKFRSAEDSEGPLDYVTDCATRIISESNYNCSPESVTRVMK